MPAQADSVVTTLDEPPWNPPQTFMRDLRGHEFPAGGVTENGSLHLELVRPHLKGETMYNHDDPSHVSEPEATGHPPRAILHLPRPRGSGAIAVADSPIQRVLVLLEAVRQTGPGKWTAKCPAHDDHHPSLSVAEGTGGRVLLHDFAGCETKAIVRSLGLEMRDLFPTRAGEYGDPAQAPLTTFCKKADLDAALDVLSRETTVVALAARVLLDGGELHAKDYEQLLVAAARIAQARAVLA